MKIKILIFDQTGFCITRMVSTASLTEKDVEAFKQDAISLFIGDFKADFSDDD